MKETEATELEVLGNRVKCPVCQYDKFWSRKTLMNTKGASFFNVDWANKQAENKVCDQCGYVLWFLQKRG
jgi:predicted nucleic-acid-binding Zn-ribbon protein